MGPPVGCGLRRLRDDVLGDRPSGTGAQVLLAELRGQARGGQFGMNALRARLVELAMAGDGDARACLLDAVPATLPARVAVRFRNSQILAIAVWLRGRVPGISDRKIAALLEVAGDAILRRRGLSMLPQLAMLTRDEQIMLRGRLVPLVGADRQWPRQRMLRVILAEGVGNPTPVEIARDVA